MAAQWGKLYSSLHDHPKMRRARKAPTGRDAAAIGLWVCAMSWCIDNYHTDGWVPAEELDRWDSSAEALAQRLVDADLWVESVRDGEDGYQFHEWDEHQETADKIDAKRERNRLRMANARGGSKPKTPAKPKATPKPKAEGDPERWAEFWAAYPKKQGKAAALKAYEKALKVTTPEKVMRGLTVAVGMWRHEGREPQFIPQPTTWLNQGRWEDEPLTDLAPAEQTRRATLEQCSNGAPHDRHQWEDSANLYHCPGA